MHESAVIGPDVRIGANVSIGPYCVLDGEIELCEGVTLEPHVQLSNKVTIGRNSIVRGGTRIGYDPFSFGASDSGEAFLFPSTGEVEIGTDVDIFHNCSRNPPRPTQTYPKTLPKHIPTLSNNSEKVTPA